MQLICKLYNIDGKKKKKKKRYSMSCTYTRDDPFRVENAIIYWLETFIKNPLSL